MRTLTKSFWALVAMIFLAEAWLWDTLGPIVGRLVALLPIERAKEAIRAGVARLSPWVTLPIFLLPGLVLTPFNFGGMWLVAHGHPLLGMATFLLAKTVGMGVAAFLFEVCKPNLMRMAWFASLYAKVLQLKAWAHRQADPYLRAARESLAAARDRIAAYLSQGRSGRRLRALRSRSRRSCKGA